MPTDHTETGFENVIESFLQTNGGFVRCDPDHFKRELALDPTVVVGFIKGNQPKAWQKHVDNDLLNISHESNRELSNSHSITVDVVIVRTVREKNALISTAVTGKIDVRAPTREV